MRLASLTSASLIVLYSTGCTLPELPETAPNHLDGITASGTKAHLTEAGWKAGRCEKLEFDDSDYWTCTFTHHSRRARITVQDCLSAFAAADYGAGIEELASRRHGRRVIDVEVTNPRAAKALVESVLAAKGTKPDDLRALLTREGLASLECMRDSGITGCKGRRDEGSFFVTVTEDREAIRDFEDFEDEGTVSRRRGKRGATAYVNLKPVAERLLRELSETAAAGVPAPDYFGVMTHRPMK